MIDTAAYCVETLLQLFPLAFLFMMRTALGVAERVFQLNENVIGDVNVVKNLSQSSPYLFLTHVGESAFALVAGAMVVGVFLFLHLGSDHAIVIGAIQKSGKGKLVFALLGPVVAVQNLLDPIEKIRTDNQGMASFVTLSIPIEESRVKRISQQAVNISFRIALAGLGVDGVPHGSQRVLPGGVQGEGALGNGSIGVINLDGVRELVVGVSQRRTARIDSLGGLFSHSFAHFFAQILDIVASNDKLNAVHEFGLGSGILPDDLTLFGQMEFYA